MFVFVNKWHNKNNPCVKMDIAIDGEIIGNLVYELFANIAPKTVANFIGQVQDNRYDNVSFHRIIPGFMIQGGDWEYGDGRGGKSIWGGNFEDENFKISHNSAGLLSMANSGPNTNGSQFFITLDNANHLDGKHVIFGCIIKSESYSGLDVLDRIESLGTMDGTPRAYITMENCKVITDKN